MLSLNNMYNFDISGISEIMDVDTVRGGSMTIENEDIGGMVKEEMKNMNLVREKVKRLDIQRCALESEAEAIVIELTTPPPPLTVNHGDDDAVPAAPMGIDTPLVDSKGFPRADIDVYRARHLRNRLAIIRTDHKNIMKQIEQGLHHLSSSTNDNKISNNSNKDEQTKRLAVKPKPKLDPKTGKWVVKNWDGSVAGIENGETRSFDHLDKQQHQEKAVTTINLTNEEAPSIITTKEHTIPFAMVDAVDDNSPAFEAGFQVGDLILTFGPDINYTNHSQLRAIAHLVPTAASKKETIPVSILRKTSHSSKEITMTIPILPKPWAGRGLLGCHIIPYYRNSSK